MNKLDVLNYHYDTLQALNEEGISFLDDIVNTANLTDNQKETVIKYAKLYLINDADMYEDGVIDFTDRLVRSPCLIWNMMSDSMSKEEFIAFFLKFFPGLKTLTLDDKLAYLKHLINPKLIEILADGSWWFINKGDFIEHGNWLGELFQDVNLDNGQDVWEDKINKLSNFLYSMITEYDNTLEDVLVKWFATVMNVNTEKMSLVDLIVSNHTGDWDNLDKNTSSDMFLINITVVLIKIWSKLDKPDNYGDVYFSYLKDVTCPIKWCTNLVRHNVIFPLDCKLLFLVLYGLKVSYSPLIYRQTQWTPLLEGLKRSVQLIDVVDAVDSVDVVDDVDLVDDEGNAVDDVDHQSQILDYRSRITFIGDRMSKAESILDSQHIHSSVNGFFKMLVNIITDLGPDTFTKLEVSDDVLQMLVLCKLESSESPNTDTEEYRRNLITLCIKVVGTTEYSKDPEIRYNFAQLFNMFHDKVDISSSANEAILIKTFEAMLQFIIDLESCYDNDVEKYVKRLNILKIILLLTKVSRDYSSIFNRVCLEVNRTKRITSIIYNSGCWLSERLNEMINKINLDRLAAYDVNTYIPNIMALYNILKNYIDLIEVVSVLIYNISSFKEISKSNEILPSLVTMLNASVKRICTEFKFEFTYLNEQRCQEVGINYQMFKIDIWKHYFSTLSTYLSMKTDERFLKLVIQDEYNFDTAYLADSIVKLRASNIAGKQSLIGPIEDLYTKLVEYKTTKYTVSDDDKTEYPDEFLDPLCYTVIEDPVVLPITDTIMEGSVIRRHLLIDQTNPFTRDPLTLEQLEEYNKHTRIVLMLREFRKRLNVFKEKDKVKS